MTDLSGNTHVNLFKKIPVSDTDECNTIDVSIRSVSNP